ncbi:MAG: hypothetical protein RLZ98_625 [Pseudomonadota bacterium]|jgi:ArsR family transcriptional regulator
MSLEHLSEEHIAPDPLIAALKAVAEPTRLRMLVLLGAGELNVTDFTRILGQSQPRISRHLKLMVEAGLIERFQEGSWAYFRLSERAACGLLGRRLIDAVDINTAQFMRDRQRRDLLMQERVAGAQAFFETYAEEWDRIRSLHVEEAAVEAAMRRALGSGPFDLLVDIGTGTGRILELFAGCYDRGVGIDINKAMLGYARAKLEARGISNAQVRHGDLYNLSIEDGASDAVVMHQVLHYLARPDQAVAEAARVLRPGGRLVVVDFAPHGLEFLRDEYAHLRLGFSPGEIAEWLVQAGLEVEDSGMVETITAARGREEALAVCLWIGRRPPVEGGVKSGQSTFQTADNE